MWLLIQSLIIIIFAVVASNIRWHWTQNVYLASVLGFLLALLLTVGLSRLIELAAEYEVGIGTIWRALQPETSEAA